MNSQRFTMYRILFLTGMFLWVGQITAQNFCFYDPNTGPFYANGSSGTTYDAVSADFNEDGKADVVTANSIAGDISFIPGNGDGSLGTPQLTLLQPTLFCITTADFDGDNHADVAVANSGTIFVLAGKGDGTFKTPVNYVAGGLPSRLYSVDVNADQIPDLVEAASNGVFVFLGKGDGTFFTATQYLATYSVNDVAIGDVDGDQKIDIVSTTHIDLFTSELSFLKGNGSGSFTPSPPIQTMTNPDNSLAGIDMADFNQDGKMDIAVANSRNTVHRVEIYLGTGGGSFAPAVYYPVSYNPFYLYVKDLDQNGTTEIIVEEKNGYSILNGNGDRTFGAFTFTSAASTPNTLVFADMDSDSKVDILIPSGYFGAQQVVVHLNCQTSTVGIGAVGEMTGEFSVYPNPTSGIVHINAPEDAVLLIYNAQGQEVFNCPVAFGNTSISVPANLSTGMYVLKLQSIDSVYTTQIQVVR